MHREQPGVEAERNSADGGPDEAYEARGLEPDGRRDQRPDDGPEQRARNLDLGKRDADLEVVEDLGIGDDSPERRDLAGRRGATDALLECQQHDAGVAERRRIEGLQIESLEGEIGKIDVAPGLVEPEAHHVPAERGFGRRVRDGVDPGDRVIDQVRRSRREAAVTPVVGGDDDEAALPAQIDRRTETLILLVDRADRRRVHDDRVSGREADPDVDEMGAALGPEDPVRREGRSSRSLTHLEVRDVAPRSVERSHQRCGRLGLARVRVVAQRVRQMRRRQERKKYECAEAAARHPRDAIDSAELKPTAAQCFRYKGAERRRPGRRPVSAACESPKCVRRKIRNGTSALRWTLSVP